MKKTFCNPLNINYKYRQELMAREGADPAVAIFNNEYYLFASHSFGYWVSPDLFNWEFIEVDIVKQPQFDLYAPAALAIGDTLYVTHGQRGHILCSKTPRDPLSWVDIGSGYLWNDPALFRDQDGSVYAYEGLSPTQPLHALKLNPENLKDVIEGPIDIFQSDQENRGFERPGDINNWTGGHTFLEGAWVNRIKDRYYLTYAVPGTEFAGYCDGCAISDSPVAPFTYCPNSPVVYKATGFMRGTGHGCLFRDLKGNYWKMGTVSISSNHNFERRICLFPASVTEDGSLYVNAYRGDYPLFCPHETEEPFSQGDAGWHLLSYGKDCKASSVLSQDRSPSMAFDENLRTWWSAGTGDPGEWLWTDLGNICRACSVQINFADQDITLSGGHNSDFSYRYTLEASLDGDNWFLLLDKSNNHLDLPHDYFQFDEPVKLRYLRLTNKGSVPGDGKFSVSGLRVFGFGSGDKPKSPPHFTAQRCEDARDMKITWEPVERAEGYYIRWGIKEDELHTHWQTIGACEATIHCLTKGVSYFVTVDAYNENGVIKGEEIQRV